MDHPLTKFLIRVCLIAALFYFMSLVFPENLLPWDITGYIKNPVLMAAAGFVVGSLTFFGQKTINSRYDY